MGVIFAVFAVIGPPREFAVEATFPEWITYTPGMATIVTISTLYVGGLGAMLLDFSLPEKRPMGNVKFGFAEPQEDEFALCSMTGRAVPMAWAFPRQAGYYGRYLTLRDASADELAEWKSSLLWLVRKLSFKYDSPLRLVFV